MYRDIKGSVSSSTYTRLLSKDMRDSHSYKSVANSPKSSPSSPPKLIGGLMFGIITLTLLVTLGPQLISSGIYLAKGSGDGAVYMLATWLKFIDKSNRPSPSKLQNSHVTGVFNTFLNA